ncbi:hypothetical protein NP493_2g01011 [Ridgeia piscesae]|uniref:Uncharacterized protein n=1 Tax=Ridgeia piscesae TaxID=27915 RepID=A0AAD9PFW8_RIDPI|nr:hypothetical protein NP493_2g01011 [Ridgeia piscesae]
MHFAFSRHIKPKTRLPEALLVENPKQQRYLDVELLHLRKCKDKIARSLERRRRAFVEKQKSKQSQWKKKDANQLDSMNFPYLPISARQLSRVDVIYKTPRYISKDGGDVVEHQTLLPPYLKIRPEMTAFVKGRADDKTYITKLPKAVEVDSTKLKRYTKFCGINEHLKPLLDHRFCNLATSLVRFGAASGVGTSLTRGRRERGDAGSDVTNSRMSTIASGSTGSWTGSREGRSLPPSRSVTFTSSTASSRRLPSVGSVGQCDAKDSAAPLLAAFCLKSKRGFVF